ncbi:hypothetical protein Anapl_14636 [Anas platyrhynchos]|uniref:Uncharacterized protein n=1 Tax=Anas platyrhynchos TaxID=8839 RepID=R0LF33_ANAPL|nr:hypothetical protein Anapl_14636 [Anas platyrhynchos]
MQQIINLGKTVRPNTSVKPNCKLDQFFSGSLKPLRGLLYKSPAKTQYKNTSFAKCWAMRNAGCSLRGTPSAMGIHKVQAVIGKTHNAGLQEAQGPDAQSPILMGFFFNTFGYIPCYNLHIRISHLTRRYPYTLQDHIQCYFAGQPKKQTASASEYCSAVLLAARAEFFEARDGMPKH